MKESRSGSRQRMLLVRAFLLVVQNAVQTRTLQIHSPTLLHGYGVIKQESISPTTSESGTCNGRSGITCTGTVRSCRKVFHIPTEAVRAASKFPLRISEVEAQTAWTAIRDQTLCRTNWELHLEQETRIVGWGAGQNQSLAIV